MAKKKKDGSAEAKKAAEKISKNEKSETKQGAAPAADGAAAQKPADDSAPKASKKTSKSSGSDKPKVITVMQPGKRSALMKPVIWFSTFLTTSRHSLSLDKTNTSELKPPFVLLCTHQSVIDDAVVEQALFPKNLNHICEVSRFAGNEIQMDRLGYIPLRRFLADSSLIYQIKAVLIKKKIAVLYPEAHYSFDGMHSPLPDLLFHVLKGINVPIVVLKVRGSYISNPCWSNIDHHTPIEATMTRVLTAAETNSLEPEDIGARIASAMRYDEYWWQLQNDVHLTSKQRAEGLHNILYLCPVCQSEYKMNSKDDQIWCENCGQHWTVSELSTLTPVEGSLNEEVIQRIHQERQAAVQAEFDRERARQAATDYAVAKRRAEQSIVSRQKEVEERQRLIVEAKMCLQQPPEFGPLPEILPMPDPPGDLPPEKAPEVEEEELPDLSRIPHWYEYQRSKLTAEIEKNLYVCEIPVTVECMRDINTGFVPLGKGKLKQNCDGLFLTYVGLDGKTQVIGESAVSSYSCHAGYDYRGKGPFIDVSTKDETFYLYPATDQCSVTKFVLAAEEIYKNARKLLTAML